MSVSCTDSISEDEALLDTRSDVSIEITGEYLGTHNEFRQGKNVIATDDKIRKIEKISNRSITMNTVPRIPKNDEYIYAGMDKQFLPNDWFTNSHGNRLLTGS